MKRGTLGPALILLALVVAAALPFTVSTFVLVQIVIKSLWLGTVAASLTFLATYGGMVSLAQTAVYGCAGYVTAYLTVTRGANPWLGALAGITVAVVVAAVIGLISARSRDIYFLMLTLACGVFVFYFASQSSALGGHGGINGTGPPTAGAISFGVPRNFYCLALAVAAGSIMLLRAYGRSSLGLALEGTRDCPERIESLGFNGTLVRVLGFAVAGVVAASGGVVALWYNGQVSPGSIDVVRIIDVLVAAVIGGIAVLEGAWVGALAVTLLATYASNYTARAETLIGAVFVAVVLFSPGGLVGLVDRLRPARGVVRRIDRDRTSAATTPIPAPVSED